MRIAWVLLASLLTIATMASAAEHTATISGAEGCGDPTFCFKVTAGSLDGIESGDSVTLTFVNDGEQIHNMFVARSSDADPQHRATPESKALAGTAAVVRAGETETITFTAPAGGFYLWCSVSGHEQLGMWLDSETGGAEGKDSPMPVLPTLLAVLGAVVVARRR